MLCAVCPSVQMPAEVCVGDSGTKMSRFWAPSAPSPLSGEGRGLRGRHSSQEGTAGPPALCCAFCAVFGGPTSSGLFRDVAQHSR